MKLLKKKTGLALLDYIGKEAHLHDAAIIDATKFIQTVMYGGRNEETLVETRVRLYQGMKTNSSETLPPDPDSVKQAVLRVHYQVYYWLRCGKRIVEEIEFT